MIIMILEDKIFQWKKVLELIKDYSKRIYFSLLKYLKKEYIY